MSSTVAEESQGDSVYSDLVSWGSKLDLWQNELVRRLAANGSLSDDDVAELAEAALMEAEQQRVEFKRLGHDDFPATSGTDTAMQLVSIGGMTNVNALRDDQFLRFGPHLTVVYGHNASGKSGYARVLKKAFRARVVDEILPDLRGDPSAAAGVASATLEFAPTDEPAESWQWAADGGSLPARFARFAVLDDKCSKTYIADSEMTIAPAGLDIPQQAATEIDRVQHHLKALAQKARPDKAALATFANDSDAGRFVAGLSAATPPEEITRHTSFEDADARALEALDAELVDLKRDTPEERRKRLQAEQRNAKSLLAFVERVERLSSDETWSALRDLKVAVSRAEQAAAAVREIGDDATRDDLLGGDPWRTLLRSAIDFVGQGSSGQSSIAVDGRCSLCWQELTPDAQKRVDQFVTYLTSDAESKVTSAKQALTDLKTAVLGLPAATPPAESELARGISATFAQELDRSVATAHARAAAMVEALDKPDWDGLPSRDASLQAGLQGLVSGAADKERAIGDEAAAAQRLADVQARRLELGTRQTLAPLRQTIIDFVRSLQMAQRYEAVARSISTRTVSKMAPDLNEKYLTARFKRAVETELKQELAFARHAPTFSTKTNKAKMSLRPIVSPEMRDIPAERVFSEGERTAISLASFLAETGITGDTSGLIFDDPISSLDHGIRARVARRLVKEAEHRQVIVFTHDLSFFADLRRAASDQGVPCESRTLSADEWAVGLIEEDMPFGARSVKGRVKVLRKMIDDMKDAGKAGRSSEARDICRHFYDRLRSTWERFVEADMFGGTVQRLEREVRPGLLHKVVVTDDIQTRVNQNYTRCSDVIEAHDTAPAAGGQASPTTTEMEADLKQLEEARQIVAKIQQGN